MNWMRVLTSSISCRYLALKAEAVTAGSAARLERGLPLEQTLFDAYPHTVVSLNCHKAEKRREGFAKPCPDFVIVDKAHTCVGTKRGRQQRFELFWACT